MKFPNILKYKKTIGLLVILIILGIVFKKPIASKVSPPPDYKTNPVTQKDIVESISASGKVKSDEEATLRFQTSGYLTWVGVKKGDRVKKWQALASLDTDELQKQLKQELLDYSNQRWDFDKDWHDNDVSDNNLDKYSLDWDIKNLLQKSQFDLDRTVLDVEIKNIALKYATLWSPIDGIVTTIDAPNAGVNIIPTSALFVISNPDKMIFSAKIDEADIGKVKLGQTAQILLDAYPDQTIDSQVSSIDFLSSVTSSGGTAYEVKFFLPDNLDQKFKSGMNGDVEIKLSQIDNALVVPFSAIKETEDKKYVWVMENNLPQRREVTTGAETDNDTQVTSGVKEGELVITNNLTQLEKTVKK